MCVHPCAEFAEKTKLRNQVDFGRKIKIKKVISFRMKIDKRL